MMVAPTVNPFTNGTLRRATSIPGSSGALWLCRYSCGSLAVVTGDSVLYHSALALDAVEKSLASGPPSKTLTIYTFTAIPEEEA